MEIKPKQITWDQIPKGWYVQPKYDGECNKLIIKNGKARLVRFEGREKTEFYPEIIEYANKFNLQDMVLVGEVCVLLDEYKASFPHIQLRMNTQNKVKQKLAMKDKLATFMAFDIEECKGYKALSKYAPYTSKASYGVRYSIMNSLVGVRQTPDEVAWKDGQPLARIMLVKNITLGDYPDWKAFVKKHEMEGIVAKNQERAAEQVKLKNWDEDEFKIVGTDLTEEGKSRGWVISKLRLEDTKGNHVDKGMQFDCKYINYPQTEDAKKLVIGKTAIIKYMKMRGRDGQYLAPRHPSLVTILEDEVLVNGC